MVLHEPQIVVSDPISDDPERERLRLHAGIEALRAEVDEMLAADYLTASGEHRDVLNAYRMFAHDKGWVRRMEASIDTRPRRRGRGREGAVGHPRPDVAAPPTPTCASGCTTSTTSSNRLLRLLSGGEQHERPRAARGRDPRRPQHRPGRAARLRPQAARRRARGGLGRQPRRDRRPGAGDPAGHPGRAHHPRGDERRRRSSSTATRASSTSAPRRPSPRRSARRSTCCTRRRRPMPRCATSRRRPATASRCTST